MCIFWSFGKYGFSITDYPSKKLRSSLDCCWDYPHEGTKLLASYGHRYQVRHLKSKSMDLIKILVQKV